ncbi:MAG TPA: 50S ribosomal protein L18 [Candidatus Saccharimonadales bacterium]|nr:50S ribosomal protein L18 [Candidatus Saccharimonadales bacterium]
MNRLIAKKMRTTRRQIRTRSNITGTTERPRLSVHVSNRHISAQLIDDSSGKTLAYVTTVGHQAEGSLSDKAGWVGDEIAKKAAKIKIKKVIFDRGGRKYHGRIKNLADTARAGGMEF